MSGARAGAAGGGCPGELAGNVLFPRRLQQELMALMVSGVPGPS